MPQKDNDTLNFADMLGVTVGEGKPNADTVTAAEAEANALIDTPAVEEVPPVVQSSPEVAPAPVVSPEMEIPAAPEVIEPQTPAPVPAPDPAPVVMTPSPSFPNVTSQPMPESVTPQPDELPAEALTAPVHDDYDESPVNYSWLHRAWLRAKHILKSKPAKYVYIGLISVGIFLLVFNIPLIIATVQYRFHKNPAPAAVPVQTTPASAPAEIVPPQPVVIIPKINVTAPIQFPPTLAESQIQIALRDGVAHYAGTGLPGQNGNDVIFGHSSNDWWQPGNYKFVFALLDRVAVGDTIQVNYQSKKYVYSVVNTKVVVPTDFSVVQPTTEPTLTLITCTPPGTSWKRLVVSAKQIEPVVNKTPQVAVSNPTQLKVLPSDASNSVWNKITNFFKNIF